MLTLTEFLLARVAEDEANLPSGHDCWYEPERYAAECEAKRRIIWLYADGSAPDDYGHLLDVMKAIALPYADHPDYREEWKP